MQGHTSRSPSAHAAEGFVAASSPDLQVLTAQDGRASLHLQRLAGSLDGSPTSSSGCPIPRSFIPMTSVSSKTPSAPRAPRQDRRSPRSIGTVAKVAPITGPKCCRASLLSLQTHSWLSSIRDIGERQHHNSACNTKPTRTR